MPRMILLDQPFTGSLELKACLSGEVISEVCGVRVSLPLCLVPYVVHLLEVCHVWVQCCEFAFPGHCVRTGCCDWTTTECWSCRVELGLVVGSICLWLAAFSATLAARVGSGLFTRS